MIVSASKLDRLFKQTFGRFLTKAQLDELQSKIETSIPQPGEVFWNSTSGSEGIYLVLAGKVRITDFEENLLVSLSSGMLFGQITLFAAGSTFVGWAK